MHRRSAACLALLAMCAAAPGAAAQRGVPALRMGDSLRVVLSAADPVLTSWGSYQAFRFQGEPARVYRFTALSDSLTATLHVARLVGALTDYIATESGGSTRSGRNLSPSLHFHPTAAGPYLVVVTAHEAGPVTLYGEEVAATPATARPLARGQGVADTLNKTSGVAVDGENVEYYALHTFAARAGDALEILVDGGVRHATGRMRDGSFEPVAPAAEGQGFISLRVPEDGEYAVRISGPADDDLPYTLRVLDASTRPQARRLEVGGTGQGTFDAATAFPIRGNPLDEWVVRASRNQRLQIDLRAPNFDTFLELGRMREGRWEQISVDDDAGDGTNSRILLEVPEDGDYVLRVRPLTGATEHPEPYTLQVASGAAGPSTIAAPRRARPETRPARWGAQLAGRLDESDAVEPDGSPYDAWTFSASAGERITIVMRSTDFDAYLAVGRDEDGEWMELSSNDDITGESTHDARVVMVAPDTGTYTIHANTLPRQPAGAYVLTVERTR